MKETTVNGNTVFVDDNYAHRWLDAIGPDVCKMVEEFVSTPFSGADQMAGWLATLIEIAGQSTVALVAGSAGGEVLFTTGTNAADGICAQLLGEAFYFGANYPTYMGIRFKVSDANQVHAMLGLMITDTTAETALSDGLYFRIVDESPTLTFVAENTTAETVVGIGTVLDNTYITAECLYLGGVFYVYVNGNQVAELANGDPNIPDDEYLTPSLVFHNGEALAKTMTVDWFRIVQVQAV